MRSPSCSSAGALLAIAISGTLLPDAAAELVPAVMEKEVILAPTEPYHVQVNIGEAKFLPFSCMGGPADVIITLSSYSEKADPLLFLSLNPVEPPTFQKHDSSNFGQWREDAAGDHYVIAKGVSPEGGILGLVNVRPFAREAVDGILSLQCTYIIAFDGLFWNHLRSEEVCPVGHGHNAVLSGMAAAAAAAAAARKEEIPSTWTDMTRFCSGHGRCVDHGVCECDGDRMGAACEHKKDDIVTAAEGRYRFSLDAGHYQYFRVRVPNDFPGGFLEVQMWGERPLVVLIRGDALPTKTNYELSNFDDWVSGRNTSVLRYQVPALAGGYSGLISEPRLATAPLQCPVKGFKEGCRTPHLEHCEDSCQICAKCVKGRDADCLEACQACTSDTCKDEFALCTETTCQDEQTQFCKNDCVGCLKCLDSNDRECKHCGCCLSCLPLAAKCGMLDKRSEEETHYIFVGVHNHKTYNNDVQVVHALADVVLKLDPKFAQREMPSSWIADLYDPFHDISSLTSPQTTDSQFYPEGEQFMYELSLTENELLRKQVRVYRDRMTLLHIPNEDASDRLMLSFTGTNVTHVLVSTHAAPKTLFDFNGAPVVTPGQEIEIETSDKSALWCAIFGGSDGWANVRAAKHKGPAEGGHPNFALICTLVLLMAFLGFGFFCGGLDAMGKTLGFDPSIPLSHQLWCFVTRQEVSHESTVGLTREDTTMSGFVSSDVIDRSIEDQFLLRGGLGDDGI